MGYVLAHDVGSTDRRYFEGEVNSCCPLLVCKANGSGLRREYSVRQIYGVSSRTERLSGRDRWRSGKRRRGVGDPDFDRIHGVTQKLSDEAKK